MDPPDFVGARSRGRLYGCVIGIWHFFRGTKHCVRGIQEMVDVVGVEHREQAVR